MKPLLLSAALCALIWPAWAVPVSISVVGPDDKPVPNAQLDLRQSDGSALYLRGETQVLNAPVRTGEGEFSLDWDGSLLAPDAPIEERIEARRLLWARVAAPGMATQTRLISAPTTQVHLTPGRAWSGVVSDGNDKPLQGVRVRLNSWTLNENAEANGQSTDDKGNYRFLDPAWAIETATDAEGRWQLDDLPQTGWANIGLSKFPYARASFTLKLSDAQAPPLFLKLGASVAGQVLKPDGQPLAGQLVVAGWNGDPEARTRTDAGGRFRIDGLEAGRTFLSATDFLERGQKPKPQFLLPQQDMVQIRAGETTDIGQWKAQVGVIVKMRVIDSGTGKPIAGAQFNSYQRGDGGESDAKGELQSRELGDDGRPMGLGAVFAEGYRSYSIAKPAKPTDGGAIDLGDIKLERGVVVKGKVRAQGETGVRDWPTLSFQMGGAGNDDYINFDGADATFASRALKPGVYSVYVYKSAGSVPSTDWEVVSPKTLTVPAPGVAAKPVEVVLKRLQPAPAVVQSARGRVVDAQGQGVAGAIVSGQFVRGYSSSGALVITDANGDWRAQTEMAATEFKLLGIERPGYVTSGDARIDVAKSEATVSGISLKRRGAPFAGRVMDADGKPAAGAWIGVVEARYYEPVRADEAGRFELSDLPLEKFTLLAGKGANWARVETDVEAKNSEIRLEPPAPFARDAAIASALEGPAEWYRVEGYWEVLGWQRMDELSGREGKTSEWGRTQFALQLADREPTVFIERAPDLLNQVSANQRAEVQARWRLAQASSDDADAKIAANNWVDEQKANKKNIDAASVTQLLQVAAVAHRLKRADAADLDDYAAAIADQVGGGKSDAAENWGRALGRSGYKATQRFVENMTPIAEFNVWKEAVTGIAQAGDVAGTEAAFARMEALAITPEWITLARKEQWNDPGNTIRYTRVEAARTLADVDINAALALIASLPDSDYGKGRAARTIADRAIAKGDLELAEKMLRGTMRNNISNPEGFALSASLAERINPQLGAELWAEALRKAVPAQPDTAFGGGFVPSVAMWAFYHARLDAAQSRVLIEREWNWQVPAAAQEKDTDEWGGAAITIERLVMAMSAIDPARALEMRAQAKADIGRAADANVGLAATLLSSDAERARFGVDGRF